MHLFPREFLVGDHYYNLGQWRQVESFHVKGGVMSVRHTDGTEASLTLERQYQVKYRGAFQPQRG